MNLRAGEGRDWQTPQRGGYRRSADADYVEGPGSGGAGAVGKVKAAQM